MGHPCGTLEKITFNDHWKYLKVNYFGLTYSKVQYLISAWEITNKFKLNPLKTIPNKKKMKRISNI